MKTINCAECNVEYRYEPNPKYPDKRKYCANCSEKKKATWDAKEEPQIEIVPGTPFETVPMNEPVIVAPKGVYKAPEKSYDLSDGNIRIGALTCTIEYFSPLNNFNEEVFWSKVKEFEEYIRNGK